MSEDKVIVVGNCRAGMSAAMATALMNSKIHVVNCEGGATRGTSELEQLLKQISDDGSENLKQLISGDMFKDLLQKEPKPARKQEPYYRRFEKRKF